jgi:hypothetical protein
MSSDDAPRDLHKIPWRDLTDDERAVLEAESLEWLRQHDVDVERLQRMQAERET